MSTEKTHKNIVGGPEDRQKAAPEKLPPGWEKAVPETLPEPVYWPFFLALGITFLLWGLLTMWVILVAGIGIGVVAVSGWIKSLNDE
ncbi:MAG TPA: hypothetical protein VHE34_03535 [Puia sp.]|uniref:hypothetical protein n=1 Tax=Puia sp. TaxID=2045100 RepID=UPI002BDD5F6A|nr:hypothetical protein [Puia sp.]HVU94265.1 hypothetical protein [Puia sp.]